MPSQSVPNVVTLPFPPSRDSLLGASSLSLPRPENDAGRPSCVHVVHSLVDVASGVVLALLAAEEEDEEEVEEQDASDDVAGHLHRHAVVIDEAFEFVVAGSVRNRVDILVLLIRSSVDVREHVVGDWRADTYLKNKV